MPTRKDYSTLLWIALLVVAALAVGFILINLYAQSRGFTTTAPATISTTPNPLN